MRRAWTVTKRTVVSFYDDQGTHHAAALTYYGLMSLFPVLLIALALLGLIGEYPRTYNAIIHYLQHVVPATTLAPLNNALRVALQSKGTAAASLVIAVLTALYGATGYLEAARRALNVVFDAKNGRGFFRRKLTDAASTVVLLGLLLATVSFMFAGGGVVHDLLGPDGTRVWRIVRWPGALVSALLVFSFVYFVTPDVKQRGFQWVTPGAAVGVALWILASVGFSAYITHVPGVNVTYGSFAAAIILIVWLWLTNVALLFGAELNAEIERQKELAEGVPESETLKLPSSG
jgi:membrane protein